MIDDTDRIRPVEPAWAEVMADDILRGVELPPITIRPATFPEVREGCEYALVIGGHRMAAHRRVGSTEIRADIVTMSRAEARIAEVDENLKRHELKALDRAVMLLERKRAWEEAYPETGHGRAPKSRKGLDEGKSQPLRLFQPGRFSAEAAERVGLSERSVQADIELASKLSPSAIVFLRRTDLVDNAAELRRLAAYAEIAQVEIAETIALGNARNVQQARIHLGKAAAAPIDPQEIIFGKLVDLYGRASARTKRRFEEHAELVRGNSREGGR